MAVTVLRNPWIPVEPTAKQIQAITDETDEQLFGGAAGGAKSWALLMMAAQYVDNPGYNFGIFRKTLQDLTLPGGLIPLSHEWGWTAKGARWNGNEHRWHFPSGATISFGYLDSPNDHYRYQGSQFHGIGIDELTQHRENQYRYLFSRVRKPSSGPAAWIPLRKRSTANPGGIGHDWVRQRFLIEEHPDRLFIPSLLTDNPHLDQEEYVKSLMHLDPITRARLLSGDWEVREGGSIFRREWFRMLDDARELETHVIDRVRYWDFAATKQKDTSDPDWTCGQLWGRTQAGEYILLDVKRIRGNPADVQRLVKRTAEEDGYNVPIYIEQEPGSSGVIVIDHYVRTVLPGFEVRGNRETGPKAERAGPLASQAEAGNVYVLRREWTNTFLDELQGFPDTAHDDQVDAASGAFRMLISAVGLSGPLDYVSARMAEEDDDDGW